MAEQDFKTLTCEQATALNKTVKSDISKYLILLEENLKPHKGTLVECCHSTEMGDDVTKLISILELMKHHLMSHMFDNSLKRDKRGRKEGVPPCNLADLKLNRGDSGISIPSQEFSRPPSKNEGCSAERYGIAENSCTVCQKHDNKNTEDRDSFNDVYINHNKIHATDLKTRFSSDDDSMQEKHSKDNSSEKKTDNNKHCDK